MSSNHYSGVNKVDVYGYIEDNDGIELPITLSTVSSVFKKFLEESTYALKLVKNKDYSTTDSLTKVLEHTDNVFSLEVKEDTVWSYYDLYTAEIRINKITYEYEDPDYELVISLETSHVDKNNGNISNRRKIRIEAASSLDGLASIFRLKKFFDIEYEPILPKIVYFENYTLSLQEIEDTFFKI